MKEAENPIVEAERYLQNARTLLSEKAGKEGNYYSDRKYVRMAGHTAWCGILIALEAVLGVAGKTTQFPQFLQETNRPFCVR